MFIVRLRRDTLWMSGWSEMWPQNLSILYFFLYIRWNVTNSQSNNGLFVDLKAYEVWCFILGYLKVHGLWNQCSPLNCLKWHFGIRNSLSSIEVNFSWNSFLESTQTHCYKILNMIFFQLLYVPVVSFSLSNINPFSLYHIYFNQNFLTS